jgi:SAM-dependent methyltransferase
MDKIETWEFITSALRDLCNAQTSAKILDLGCGAGKTVAYLRSVGFDAWGCDSKEFITLFKGGEYLLDIAPSPYRLPAEDNSFDAVISSSVLEHAGNKEEIFREIHRVLKPGGITLHILPGKYYLPAEPHIYVPLVNWFWPNVPAWWLALWAIAGVRNEFQQGYGWRQVVTANVQYCKAGLSYWPHRRLKRNVTAIFGNCHFPNDYYVRMAYGGAARLARKLPFPHQLTGWLMGHLREGLLLAKKTADG